MSGASVEELYKNYTDLADAEENVTQVSQSMVYLFYMSDPSSADIGSYGDDVIVVFLFSLKSTRHVAAHKKKSKNLHHVKLSLLN